MSNIAYTRNILISSEVLAQVVDGETVLLDMKTENYFALDPVGTRIWQLMQEHKQVQKVFDIMLQEYDVDKNQLETDLNNLLEKLTEQHLITVE